MSVSSLVIGATALAAVVVAASASAQEMQAVRGVAPHRLATARLLRAAAPDETLHMSITLRLRDPDGLAALLAAQQRPGAVEYRQWLSPAQFAERFAPPVEIYAGLVDWLQRAGFTVAPWPHRLRIDFDGTVDQVEHAFRVRMHQYEHGARRVLATSDAPAVPTQLAPVVEMVRLDTIPFAGPLVRINGPAGQQTVMGPHDMHLVYNLQPLLDRGKDGAGQTLAVVARSDFKLSDIALFRQQFGLPAAVPRKVFPAGNPGIGAIDGACRNVHGSQSQQQCIQGEEGEVLIDTQWSGALAPGADVLVDIADTDIDASLTDIVTHHPEATVITMSFGGCERLDGGDSLVVFAPLYAQAAAQGQTVFVSTGDSGADNCQDGRGASVNVLASDPNVTAVSGTILQPGFDSSGNATGYVSERVWNDQDGATGGGASALIAKPAYQDVPGVPTDAARDQPDVALVASPLSPGYVVVFEGATAVVGGTSLAAPSWAGIATVLNHAAGADGFGALNPALYRLGRKQYKYGVATVFHDVTAGNTSFNGVHGVSAGLGYDLATGLGTPDADQLARALTECIGDCNGDGEVTVDEMITGINIALSQVPLGRCAAFDADANGEITLDELIRGTNVVLNGCSGAPASS